MAIATLAVLDDDDAFAARSARLATAGQARAAYARYRDAREKSPAFAGVLSALIPGAGQLYAGSLQAAAVTFVLNGLFIGATVELARDEHYFTAAAAGTAASFFYVGGIMNAVDLARRRNDIAQELHREALESLLVPELTGAF
jgi:TM2 domain-containing membrane protein YozV